MAQLRIPRVSSNLAESLDCSHGGSRAEVRPTGVGSCEVRDEKQVPRERPPPQPLFSGTGPLSLLPVFPAAGGGTLPATCARRACSREAGRSRRGGPRRAGPGGLPSSPPARSGCLEEDLNAARSHREATGRRGGPAPTVGRASAGQARRRGRLASGLGGVRAGTGARDPREEGARRPPPFNWPRRPLAGEAGGGGPPLVGLAGQSLKGRGRRRGAVRAGLRRRLGASAGPPPTEQPRHRPAPAVASGRLLRRPGERAPSISGCGHSSGPGAWKPSARNLRTRAQPLPAARIIMTHFNKGPSYGLSAEVKNKIASKYDHQAEEDLRNWIEEVTGMSIGTSFQLGLKDGIILCELINKLQPGSVKKVNESSLNWPQLENIGNFIKAIQAYGMKPHDIFEANDLFENGNMTQVQTTLVALAGLAKTKGFHTTIDIGVKYAEKQTRRFDEGKLKAGQSVIGLQMGTNKCASQAGMTAYGTRRHLYDPKMQTDKPFDQTTISLQMGTNKGASQAGMLAPGTRRDIYDQKLTLQPVDNSTISLQMGTNKVASQKGMSVYGLGRQVYDPKYCAAPTEPVIHNGSQGTGTNGSEISDSDYQAEYPDEYHGEYPDDYPRDYQYGDQGIDY